LQDGNRRGREERKRSSFKKKSNLFLLYHEGSRDRESEMVALCEFCGPVQSSVCGVWFLLKLVVYYIYH